MLAQCHEGWFKYICDISKPSLVQKLREPLSILIKYKTIGTPKIDNTLKIYFDVSTKL